MIHLLVTKLLPRDDLILNRQAAAETLNTFSAHETGLLDGCFFRISNVTSVSSPSLIKVYIHAPWVPLRFDTHSNAVNFFAFLLLGGVDGANTPPIHLGVVRRPSNPPVTLAKSRLS